MPSPPAIATAIRSPLLAILLVTAGAAAGCEPAAPGASGVISLAPGAQPIAFKTLALRAFARPSGAFDPSRPISHNLSKNEPLTALSFPHPYRIGGGIGKVDFTDWLFVAWFSQRGSDDLHDDVDGLDPGDVFCAVPFRVARARSSSDAVTYNVDCTLAEVVPARR